MTNYAEQFASLFPSIEQAFSSMPGEPTTVPGLTKEGLISFSRSFEPLLARVDEGTGIEFATLAYSNTSVPQHVLNLFPTVISQAPNGTDHIVQNYLPTLLDLRNRLESATGASATPEQNPPALRKKLAAVDRLLSEGLKEAEAVSGRSADLETALESAKGVVEETETQRAKLQELVDEIEKLRTRAKFVVEDDSDPDSPSIDAIYTQLNGRRSQAEDEIKKIDEAVKRANKAAATAEQLKGNTENLRKEAQGVLEQARTAMRGATQAGLAESFISERDSKMWGLLVYGAALVIAVAGAVLFATLEVLPAIDDLTAAIANRQENVGALSTGLLIRSVLLAPFVFLGWFAALQYRRIDLLRIDYAAKAAAAKAFIGYKDEVKGDQKLVSALKGFLIQRFGEHPVRLVTKEHDENVPLDLFNLGSGGKSGRAPTNQAEADPAGEAS